MSNPVSSKMNRYISNVNNANYLGRFNLSVFLSVTKSKINRQTANLAWESINNGGGSDDGSRVVRSGNGSSTNSNMS